MEKLTPDEQILYIFAFRYSLQRNSCALSLVSRLIVERVAEFEDWQLRDMIGEVEEYWATNKDILVVDRDLQRLFRDRLQDALSGRSAEAAR